MVKSGGTRKEFEFDKVFAQEVSQGEMSVQVEMRFPWVLLEHI